MTTAVRVLVVDDAAESREILARALGFDDAIEVVGEADSGASAVRQADELRPDVVLMDVRMPDGDGITATREITRRLPQVHVIALTAHDDQDSVRDMLTAGATGYLVKGAPVDEVTAAIHKARVGEAQVDDRVLPHVIDELRELLTHERSRREEAERLARARLEFIQVLSHELRTPLTVIGGALQTVQMEPIPDDVQDLVRAAVERTRNLEQLVEGLELIGQAPPTPGHTANPSSAVTSALSALPIRPDDVEAPNEAWHGIHEHHLTRVIRELVANATQHGRAPVTVRVRRLDMEGIVEVSDAGDFEPDPALLGPFVQGDMSTMREQGGLGLGLFVVGRLCEAGGGRLELRREGGRTVAEARFSLAP